MLSFVHRVGEDAALVMLLREVHELAAWGSGSIYGRPSSAFLMYGTRRRRSLSRDC